MWACGGPHPSSHACMQLRCHLPRQPGNAQRYYCHGSRSARMHGPNGACARCGHIHPARTVVSTLQGGMPMRRWLGCCLAWRAGDDGGGHEEAQPAIPAMGARPRQGARAAAPPWCGCVDCVAAAWTAAVCRGTAQMPCVHAAAPCLPVTSGHIICWRGVPRRALSDVSAAMRVCVHACSRWACG